MFASVVTTGNANGTVTSNASNTITLHAPPGSGNSGVTFSVSSTYTVTISGQELEPLGAAFAYAGFYIPQFVFLAQTPPLGDGTWPGMLNSAQFTFVHCPCRFTLRLYAKAFAESGGSASVEDPFTVNLPPGWTYTVDSDDQIARAAFRDTNGAIQMTTYPSATLSYAGGVFASDPSPAEDSLGNIFVSARDTSNAIWANVYDSSTSTWAGWIPGGGIIQGAPSIAVDTGGTAWISSRDTFNSYWLVSYSSTLGFGAWMPLRGIFSTDPVITSCSDGSIYLIGKDTFNSLWSGHYIPGTGFQGWRFGGGIIQGKPAATCGSDNAVYIAAEDNFNSNWMARVSGNTWTGWSTAEPSPASRRVSHRWAMGSRH